MKRILLSSAAVFAFAGAAFADGHQAITFSGSATLGYNDNAAGDHDGFYSDLNLDVTMSATLDNGITVSATADVDELDASDDAAGGVTLKVASETTSLTYGDVEFAAVDMWSSVGSMDNDGFSEQDGEIVLRGDATFGDVSAALSYTVDDTDLTSAEDLQFGMKAALGSANVSVALQEAGEIYGVSVSTTLGGVDLGLGYASTDGDSSTGISVGYTTGPVALAASYVSESAGDDNWDVSATYAQDGTSVKVYTDEDEDYGFEASYDVGNGMVVYAGYDHGDETTYVAGTYDLGGDASLLVSYVDGSNADDEIGPNDYQAGATVAVSFAF